MKNKLNLLLKYLNHGLIERQTTVKLTLLASLSCENIFFIGPPGSGKSLITRRLAHIYKPSEKPNYFEYRLTSNSRTEEIFGPLLINGIKSNALKKITKGSIAFTHDQFKRDTNGYLPTATLAFLDDVFKADSSILNALLNILDTNTYHNGNEAQPTVLQTLIASSYQLPTSPKEEFYSLYDRFIIRCTLNYAEEHNKLLQSEQTLNQPIPEPLTENDLNNISALSKEISLTEEILDNIQKIAGAYRAKFKNNPHETLSDRRLKKIVQLLRVSAVTNQRTTVDLSDLILLKHCLWNHPDNKKEVEKIIFDTLERSNHPLFFNEEQSLNINDNKHSKKLKGLTGNGTEKSPFLIKNLEDFIELGRPEIGQNGFFFQQTGDINFHQLSTWPSINFRGHYNGNGYTLHHHGNHYLFFRVGSESTLKNIKLDQLGLAEVIEKSHISDCQITLNWTGSANEERGGVVRIACNNSVIERCFVNGHSHYDSNSYFYPAGFTTLCHTSTIRYCVLGHFKTEGYVRLYCASANLENATMELNIASDANTYWGKKGCQTIASVLLNQRYFENTLGYDFINIWYWNEQQNIPSLRPGGNKKSAEENNKGLDLLSAQIRANIWL